MAESMAELMDSLAAEVVDSVLGFVAVNPVK